MQKLSRTEAGNTVVCAVAGVYTSQTFMEDICRTFVQMLERKTRLHVVRSGLLFPYGHQDSGLVRQLRLVGRDMLVQKGPYEKSIGGRVLIDLIGNLDGVDYLMLIGHSGGGVASVHAAAMLQKRRPELTSYILQVGCPRFITAPELKERVLYLYAVNEDSGSPKDPICRIGSWGGWEKGPHGVPRWNPEKYAPIDRIPVPIIGNHADYFRSREPFRNQSGLSNLEIVAETLIEGIVEDEA